MRVILIGLQREAATLLRSWLEAAGIGVEDPSAPAEDIAARCQLAIVDVRRIGPAARLARDAWKQSWGLSVLAIVGNPMDGMNTLQAGADDFIAWPLDADQLIARVRRLEAAQARTPKTRLITIEGIVFDTVAQTVEVGGERVRLTTKCFVLALLFMRNIGRRLSRAEIVTAIWGTRPDLNSRTLDAHVSQVRRVLSLSNQPRLALRSNYGHGYELTCETLGGARSVPADEEQPAPRRRA